MKQQPHASQPSSSREPGEGLQAVGRRAPGVGGDEAADAGEDAGGGAAGQRGGVVRAEQHRQQDCSGHLAVEAGRWRERQRGGGSGSEA